MLLEFTVSNFRSIKDPVTFSMVADKKKSSNSFRIRFYDLLNSSVIYGHNASGKSNVVKALAFMKEFVLNKSKVIQSTDKLPHEPFKLSTETENASSSFEIVFFIGGIKYRYGFESDSEIIYSEWLFADERGKEAKLFFRDKEEETQYVNTIKFREGLVGKNKMLDRLLAKVRDDKKYEDMVKELYDKPEVSKTVGDNQLFLWKCDQGGGRISKTILKWFDNLNIVDSINHHEYTDQVAQKMSNTDFRDKVSQLLRVADLGIQEVEKPRDESSTVETNDRLKTKVRIPHLKYDENNNIVDKVQFDLEKDESVGTNKFFAMAAPILDTLENGRILMVDELDASLHPMLTRHLIALFHNEKTNKKNAQLVFVTHDINLLKKKSIFNRDQIWFTEKNEYGVTHLVSLLEYKGVRNTDNFEKHYIQGKYGAIPFLADFDTMEV